MLGRPDQLPPVYARLRDYGIADPTAAETAVEKITGAPSIGRQWSYRERRKDLVLALLDDHADRLDKAADELGALFDHLRQVGIRGFIAEHTNDADFAYVGEEPLDEPSPAGTDAAVARKPKRTSKTRS